MVVAEKKCVPINYKSILKKVSYFLVLPRMVAELVKWCAAQKDHLVGITNEGSGSEKSNRPPSSKGQYIPEGQSDRMNNATIPFIAQYGNNSGD